MKEGKKREVKNTEEKWRQVKEDNEAIINRRKKEGRKVNNRKKNKRMKEKKKKVKNR